VAAAVGVARKARDGRWALERDAVAQALAQRGERLRVVVFCLLVRLLQRLLQWRLRRERRVRLMLLLTVLALLAMQARRRGRAVKRRRPVPVRQGRERRKGHPARRRIRPTRRHRTIVFRASRNGAGRSREYHGERRTLRQAWGADGRRNRVVRHHRHRCRSALLTLGRPHRHR